MDEKAYNKCDFIIRQFMATENRTPELASGFYDWLLNGRDCREKEAAFRRLFDEALTEDDPPSSPQHNENLVTEIFN